MSLWDCSVGCIWSDVIAVKTVPNSFTIPMTFVCKNNMKNGKEWQKFKLLHSAALSTFSQDITKYDEPFFFFALVGVFLFACNDPYYHIPKRIACNFFPGHIIRSHSFAEYFAEDNFSISFMMIFQGFSLWLLFFALVKWQWHTPPPLSSSPPPLKPQQCISSKNTTLCIVRWQLKIHSEHENNTKHIWRTQTSNNVIALYVEMQRPLCFRSSCSLNIFAIFSNYLYILFFVCWTQMKRPTESISPEQGKHKKKSTTAKETKHNTTPDQTPTFRFCLPYK